MSRTALYSYFGTKHPHEFKSCDECQVKGWIQRRRRFCSRRCSKLGDRNPSKQKAAGHGLTVNEYVRAHALVRQARGKAASCAFGCVGRRMYHWANLLGDYWDVGDYAAMCVPCHDGFDRGSNGAG